MQARQRAATAAAVLLAAATLAPRLAAAAKAAEGVSELWGEDGELWDPAGPLLDFSYAGYRQGNAQLPDPPVTRSVLDWRQGSGGNDTAMLQAALAWACSQPLTDDYIVLGLPAGEYTLEAPLLINRSRVVLRGEGSESVELYVPKSLYGLYGQNPAAAPPYGYINNGGFIAINGSDARGMAVTNVTGEAQRGDRNVTVSDAAGLRVGDWVDLWYQDVDDAFNELMYDNKWPAPEGKFSNTERVRLATRILAVNGQTLTLERRLPYPIRPGLNVVRLYRRLAAVEESGVQGLTLRFEFELYGGHHLEKGWNGVFVWGVRDCWVKDIATINADSSVLVWESVGVTVTGITVRHSKSRANELPNPLNESAAYDGHWGVLHVRSFDVLLTGFDMSGQLVHDVGTGSGSKFGVFADGVMVDGNLDLHRALAGPSLYTNISVGKGSNGLKSGGPGGSGPNAVAGTTWWGIRSENPLDPNRSNGTAGACSFGPSIILVGVDIKEEKVDSMCDSWWYERGPVIPESLYAAQLALRRKEEAQGLRGQLPPAAPSQPSLAAPSPAPAPASSGGGAPGGAATALSAAAALAAAASLFIY